MPSPSTPMTPSWRRLVHPTIAIAATAAAILVLADDVGHHLRLRGIRSGFDFLAQPAGFGIGESPIAFDPTRSYWCAFAVGLANTLRVAVVGIVLSTVLGTLLGVGRFSRSLPVRGLCRAYVEAFRNVPVLLQLLMWYLVITEALPGASAAWRLGPLFVSKGGLALPMPPTFETPRQGEFAVEGGTVLTPEFVALLVGLTLYTSAFVAEVVRAGIGAVPRGQSDAAAALGLGRRQTFRFVVLPQALRVIVPALTNQSLGLTKNASLAVAIGYPDVVSIANTTLNQTGRAVECISMVMAIYLTLSLVTSASMRRYDAPTALAAR